MARPILLALLLILLIVAAINALLNDFFSNTFEIDRFLTILSIAGLFCGSLIAYLIIRKSVSSDGIAKVQIALGCLIFSLLFCVAAGVNLNYLLAKKPLTAASYLILDIKPFFKTGGGILKGEKVVPNGYVVYFEKEGETTEIRYKTMQNFQAQIGKQMELDIRSGLLGFEVFVPDNHSGD